MREPSQRVVVTGASGFIGMHLVEALARTREVVTIDRRAPTATPAGVRSLVQDVLSDGWESEIGEGDTVVHLAGASGTRDASEEMCRRDNVEATVRVAELAARGGARMIVASSSSVYGGPPPNREDDPCTPLNHYGESKLEAERRAIEILGDRALALRFFTVYGPGQRGNMLFSRAIAAALLGETLTVHDPDATRDFTFVAEVVRAIRLAIDTTGAHGVINIGAGETHSVSEALAIIESATRRTIETQYREAGVAEPHQTQADVARAASELGFTNAISLEDGIARQLAAALDAQPLTPLANST